MREGGRKLNLVMTYPIRWSMSHIMEDYIQNFYDVIGAEKFAQDFVYFYDESRRELRMEGKKGFHVEWLQYIGASTKGEYSAHYIVWAKTREKDTYFEVGIVQSLENRGNLWKKLTNRNIQNKFGVEMRKRKLMRHREYRRCWQLLLIKSMKKIGKQSIERMPLLVGIGMTSDLHCQSMMGKKLNDTMYSMR